MNETKLRRTPRTVLLAVAGLLSFVLLLAACEENGDPFGMATPTPTDSEQVTPTPDPEAIDGSGSGTVAFVDPVANTVGVVLETGELVTLMVDASTAITVDGAPADLAGLGADMAVEVAFDPATMVASSIDAEADGLGLVSATGPVALLDVTEGTIAVTVSDEETLGFFVDESTEITVDGQAATLADIEPGFSASVEYDGASYVAVSIEATSSDGNGDGPGDSGNTESVTAQVSSVFASAGILVLALETGESLTLNVDGSTEIVVNGQAAMLSAVQAGAVVAVEYDAETLVATSVTTGEPGEEQEVPEETAEGTVTSIDGELRRVTLTVSVGESVAIWVVDTTTITVAGTPASFEEISTGAEALITYDAATLQALSIEIDRAEGLTVSGVVESYDNTGGQLVVAEDGGQSVTVLITADTVVTLNGEAATASDVTTGDRVMVAYDAETLTASTVDVERQEHDVTGMVLSYEDSNNQLIVVSETPEVLTLVLPAGAEITANGEPAGPFDLTPGALVSVAYDMGTMQVASVVISGSVSVDEGTVQAVDGTGTYVTLNVADTLTTYWVTDETEFVIDNVSGALSDITPGTSVVIVYDEASYNARFVLVM